MNEFRDQLKKEGVSLCSTIIVMDNAPIHVSNYSKTQIKDIRLQCLTICPYGPSLNPIEKVIGVIKSRWKRLAYDGKIKLDSSDVQKIAYSLHPETIQKCCLQSKVEAIN